jgi:hypothetical protein
MSQSNKGADHERATRYGPPTAIGDVAAIGAVCNFAMF